MRYGFHGPSLSPSTACTTGSHALGDAFSLIRMGALSGGGNTPLMIAGASESCIIPIALAGFARARSLSTSFNDKPSAASRPFDSQRDGFVVSEGAAIMVLEELEHAKERGASIYAEVIGYGLSSDAYHITAPHPKGLGAYLSMKRALESAGISPGEVDYVNAHATGTSLGDAAENRAIRDLLVKEGGQSPKDVNVSSVKGAVGHMLGASGALEGVFTTLALKEGILPPTANLDKAGDAEGQSAGAEVEDVGNMWDLNYVPRVKQEKDIKIALSNSFGFGGTCATLCLRKYTE
jgi:3-oxoacyl-[acyl-carrier-protein] synthase II